MVVTDTYEYLCEEEKRLQEDRTRERYWKKWGSYLSERQWATGMEGFDEQLQTISLTDSLAI